MSTFQDLAHEMRAAGIKRVRFQPSGPGEPQVVIELELSDTIPAPPSFEADEPEPEAKPPGICQAKGCGEKVGGIIPGFCRRCGLLEAGVNVVGS